MRLLTHTYFEVATVLLGMPKRARKLFLHIFAKSSPSFERKLRRCQHSLDNLSGQTGCLVIASQDGPSSAACQVQSGSLLVESMHSTFHQRFTQFCIFSALFHLEGGSNGGPRLRRRNNGGGPVFF